jgi:glycosyltransferase involved in cell wall biosynthesis
MFGDDRVEILVIDNHSTDGTEEFLARQTDVRSIRTPLNIGHGLGLDLAFARADTSHGVALDVDAFLISQAWLPAVLDPLANGAIVAGAYVQRAFIHPSLLAMRRTDYFRLNLRFVPIGVPTPPGDVPRGIFMDVGEVLGQTVAVVEGTKALHRIPITASRDHNLVGSVYGDVVYHNFYSTQGKPELVHAALAARVEAVAEYLSP